ncbi:hypothetical protein BS47DRAFT_1402428 [Hydnum rufescens UP504]|uniref:Uncharacterized protein n=1 Tax=Hydnum rufescens UP504 TaxID=1448309 RepID=A0A9P6ACV6_9AGAM|nr:hypothetical protein BS47DRAFT_1402428 [Hydnum rufescens UP504]
MTDSAHFDSTASSAQGYTDEDPVFVSLIKKEENKTSEGFWPDSVNTSGAIVKQYNNDESSKVDQLVGLSFQRMLDPCLTLHPFIDNFYPQTRIPLNSPPLSTVQTPLPISQNIAPSNQNAKEENAKRPTTLTAQQLHEIFDSSTEPSTRSTRSSIPRPGKNSNSYRAWPSYRQAIIDHERNAAQKLEEVRKNYEIQRSEDIKRHADLLDQLSRTIYNLQNNEWDEFKDTTTEFELKELPSNPGIEIVSDNDSSSW